MKTHTKIIITILSMALVLSACQNKQISPEKQAILQEIEEKVEEYNAFLEEEKAKGQYVEVRLNGKEAIEFIDSSSIRVFGEFQKTVDEITLLNENYYYYSVQEDPSISYPNPNVGENTGEMVAEFNEFMANEIQNGDKVTLVSANGTIVEIPIGNSYVAIKQKNRALPMPVLETVIPLIFTSYENFTVTSGMYVKIIRSIEENDANVRFLRQSTNSSMMYPEFEQLEFKGGDRNYYFDLKTNQIFGIFSDLTPSFGSRLSAQELEKIARNMVAKISPGIDLNQLQFRHWSENGEYFFEWASYEKRLNDGSPAIIQVTLTENGDLYAYSNLILVAK